MWGVFMIKIYGAVAQKRMVYVLVSRSKIRECGENQAPNVQHKGCLERQLLSRTSIEKLLSLPMYFELLDNVHQCITLPIPEYETLIKHRRRKPCDKYCEQNEDRVYPGVREPRRADGDPDKDEDAQSADDELLPGALAREAVA